MEAIILRHLLRILPTSLTLGSGANLQSVSPSACFFGLKGYKLDIIRLSFPFGGVPQSSWTPPWNSRIPKSTGETLVVEEKLVVREVGGAAPSMNTDGALDDEMDAIDPGREMLSRWDLADTGITTPSPPRPNRENLGVGSVLVTQFVPGSRDVDSRRREATVTGAGSTIASIDTDLTFVILGLVNKRSGVYDIRDGLYLGIV